MQIFHIFLDLDLENDLSLTCDKFEMQTNRIHWKNYCEKKTYFMGLYDVNSETIAIY